ncbi:hypothetical protein OJAV_G00068590 [Oryzias javanicus]|uniref:F-box domain-containing protein n=1 Tax=Oryzias javanicus TaxID=123683 RepID=A0A3S2PVM4_ORYJA|nr:hypothetical protein OJAV_G00068590 [Oryzias javanicus]
MKRNFKVMGSTQSADLNVQNDSGKPAFLFPLDILEEIFLNVPPHQVVRDCSLVCHEWKEVADRESFWRERCRREGYHIRNASKIPSDWKYFYFTCKTKRNLLKNPRGEDGLNGWTIEENGGDHWKIEAPMASHPKEEVQKNFVTSYGMCLNHTSGYLIGTRLDGIAAWNDQQWNLFNHVFKDYGPGVRYIKFTHGGKDTQFWAGWYGVRVTDSCVEICPADD